MKKSLLISISLLLGITATQAVPAYRGALKAVQSDGTTVTFFMQGDEFGHRCVSKDGFLLLQDEQGTYRYAQLDGNNKLTCEGTPIAHDPAERGPVEQQFVQSLPAASELYNKVKVAAEAQDRAAMSHATKQSCSHGAPAKESANSMSRYQVGSYPTLGEGRCLVLLVEFTDTKFSLNKDFHTRLLNEKGFSDNGATGSAKDFYKAQSMGKFVPTFDVVGPITLDHSAAYYGKDDSMLGKDVNAGKMIRDACQMADENFGVDFTQYDGDGDGTVEMVYVIYAGYGQHAGGGSNTIWPHKYQLSAFGYDLTLDGKTIETYACSSELFGNSGTVSSGIGTICHEFGHVLGLADHYNTSNSTDYKLGRYDIMDYGSYNNDGNTPPSYNAFERMSLGWMTPTELTEKADGLTLGNIAETNAAYLIRTSNEDEFYLLENRQQTGWDTYLKGSGLMITHVDFDKSTWTSNALNTDSNHPCFYLIPADGEPTYDELAYKETERYDLYPSNGNDSFTDNSSPSAAPYTGETLDQWVSNIQNNDGVVSFDFMANHLLTPKNLKAEVENGTNINVTWEEVEKATNYDLALHKLDYRSAQQYAVSEDFSLMTEGSTDTPSATKIDDQLDNYLTTKGFSGKNVYQAGGWCQIGNATEGGSLTTPNFNMKRFDGEYAVVLTAKSVAGKQPVLSVSSNGQTGKTRINSVSRTYLFQFKGGISQTPISIATNTERALFDSLFIVRGNGAALYPDAKVITVSGTPEVTEGDVEDTDFIHTDTLTVNGVKNLSYTFTALQPETYYSVTVKALGDNTAQSLYADEVVVLTGSATAIEGIMRDFSDGKTEIFTSDGRRVSDMHKPGLYIVRTSGNVRKYLVK